MKTFLGQFFDSIYSLIPFLATIMVLKSVKKLVTVWHLISIEKFEVLVAGGSGEKSGIK